MLYGHLSCEDNRDKVYGLLGLIDAGDMPTFDYCKSVEEIFLDVVKVVLMEQEITLGILHSTYLVHLATTIALPMRELRPLKSFLEDICDKTIQGLSVCGATHHHSPCNEYTCKKKELERMSMGFEPYTYEKQAYWWYIYDGQTYTVECESSLFQRKALSTTWRKLFKTQIPNLI
jgi:hypothetical protein